MDTNDISACERLVMKVIWDSTEDLALQDIMNRVNQENGKSWKPQTVSTFLARLVRKSFLTVYRKGRYSFYQPAVSKEDFWKATVQENARYFDKGDMAAFACHLCEDALTKEEIQVLKKKLDELNQSDIFDYPDRLFYRYGQSGVLEVISAIITETGPQIDICDITVCMHDVYSSVWISDRQTDMAGISAGRQHMET